MIKVTLSPSLDPERPLQTMQVLKEILMNENPPDAEISIRLTTALHRVQIWAAIHCSDSMIRAITQTGRETLDKLSSFPVSQEIRFFKLHLSHLIEVMDKEISERQKGDEAQKTIGYFPPSQKNCLWPDDSKCSNEYTYASDQCQYKGSKSEGQLNPAPMPPSEQIVQIIQDLMDGPYLSGDELQKKIMILRFRIFRNNTEAAPLSEEKIILLIRRVQTRFQNSIAPVGIKLFCQLQLERIIEDMQSGILKKN